MERNMHSEVIKANIDVHTMMADTYNSKEPHFRPENRAKVRANLEALKAKGGDKLLDIGCGTGFIIDLAKDLFPEIRGVDVTQAMLDRVDVSSGNISLLNCSAEKLPYSDDYFDVVTAYAFLHHVEDYRKILREVFRVLKRGGSFYIDLEPNSVFWTAMEDLDRVRKDGRFALSDIVLKEIDSVLYTDDRVEKEFGIEKDVFNKAEYTKSILGGIDPPRFMEDTRNIGFSECTVSYEWFLGQGAVMHGQSMQDALIVENYLRKVLPLSRGLFKYLKFILVK
jgi:ubiquinone/menaquinone biosynthesis C-methylase UbiE